MLKENLIMLRNIHGYSQEEIAGKIEISRQAYAKWESGATVPDIEKCKRLADVYGVTIDSLLKTATYAAASKGEEYMGQRYDKRAWADSDTQRSA